MTRQEFLKKVVELQAEAEFILRDVDIDIELI